jgi:hypothetical protein
MAESSPMNRPLMLGYRLKFGGGVWHFSLYLYHLQPKPHILLLSAGGTARLLLSWRDARLPPTTQPGWNLFLTLCRARR